MNDNIILILSPHTDDGELACGATISKYVRKGKQVYYVAFSSCDKSLPEDFPKGTLKIELYNAMQTLGIPKENVFILDYEVRNFAAHRQEILDDMINFGRKINPDIILMPSTKDIHQDHYTIAKEGLRAFKKNTILCYEVPWNNFAFENQVFSCVEEKDALRKIAAVKCYKSQESRLYTSEDYIKSLLISHGVQVGVKYAEVFEIPRLILN